MIDKTPATPFSSDVLHGDGRSKLTREEIAKAIARHQREHPGSRAKNAPAKAQKTKPRR